MHDCSFASAPSSDSRRLFGFWVALSEANRITGSDVIVQAIGKKRDLLTVFACNEAFHPDPPEQDRRYLTRLFSHSLDPNRTLLRAGLGMPHGWRLPIHEGSPQPL